MNTFVSCVLIALCATGAGFAVGLTQGVDMERKHLGTAICKKLSGSYARLDDQPVCINPAGGILKFYD